MESGALKSRIAKCAFVLVAIAVFASASTPVVQTRGAKEHCADLVEADFSTLMDAPTQITASNVVASKNDLPEYCQVEGYVAPQVGFEMRLPFSDWNGKFLEVGNAGWGGRIDGQRCNSFLRRGYACIRSDTGHHGGGARELWATQNLPAQIDFAFRAVHVSALAGKAIVEHFYSRAPQRSYFVGCSTGGYEGLVEAQRFPWDFDGIVAGSPDMDEADLVMREIWNTKNFLDQAGQPILSPSDIQLLHGAVLNDCDMDDGVRDGIIGNAVSCNFDPAKLLCKADKIESCLTKSQVDAIRRIYAGPTTSTGYRISTRGVLPGSELGWKDLGPIGLENGDGLLRYMVYGANPEWKPNDFDFDRDYKRLGLAGLYTDTNPDLRKFKSAGGKLIVYQGSNDLLEVPGGIIDYYETTERAMGGLVPTQDFFRFFMVPGMGHCGGGVGASTFDSLSYLEKWVERNQAPDRIITVHISEDYLAARPGLFDISQGLTPFPLDPSIPIPFTRPVFPYPDYASYSGHGDVNRAENFERRSPQVPTP